MFLHMDKDNNKVYLTKEGLQKIQKELDELRDKTRPRMVDRLSLARAQGDLTENNEYASAREELVFIDGRIEELEGVLQNICLIDENHSSCQCVGLGCRVTIITGENEQVYHIVGEWEADPVQRKVSHSSPLGQALIGKKIGEEVAFEAPVGKILYKILKIE